MGVFVLHGPAGADALVVRTLRFGSFLSPSIVGVEFDVIANRYGSRARRWMIADAEIQASEKEEWYDTDGYDSA